MQTSVIQGFRLSYPQRRIWLLQQQDAVYQAQAVLTVSGLLDRDSLRQAIAQVIERHDILRTTFHSQPSLKLPLQVISSKASYTWLEVDLSQNARSQAANLADVTQREGESGFEWEGGPLLRVTLLTVAAHEHRLIITLPALLADARTLSRFVQEVSQHYGLAAIASLKDAELAGLKDAELAEPVAEPPVQYLQFSEWQHALLEEPNAEAGKAYWQQQFVSTNSTLPFELHPIGRAAFQPQADSWPLSTDLTRHLSAIAHHHHTSLATVLFTTWQLLLWRLHSESEVGMGWVTQGRPYDELAEVMGAFAQTIPIRNPWANSFCWSECLQRTASTLETAQTWQDYFTELDDQHTQTPQFLPYSFEFTEPWEPQTAAGVTFALAHQSVYGDRFKLKLSCELQVDTLCLTLHFDANCFEHSAIACLAAQYQTLLDQVAAHPETTLAELNFLSPSQRQQLLHEFNPPQQKEFTLDAVHHRFARQVEQTPDAIALVFDDQQLTYAELNHRAEQIAHHLKGLGVGADVIVALYLERSIETVVGLLGVLKAGGAYLPIDPTFPVAGLRARLQDAQAAVLITQQLTQQRFAAALSLMQIPVLCLKAEFWTEEGDRPGLLGPSASDCSLAYVIYTSGSTGQPKGVAVEHRQLSQYLNSILEQLEEPLPVSFVIASTFAADLGHTMTFAALCTGGCLHILSVERATNAAALAAYCQSHTIDCLKLVPSHLAALLAAGASAQILPQQWLILGGEAITWDLIDTLQQHTPSCRILNHYGPTETTVGALTYAVPSLSQSRPATVPLGHPLPHAQVYVLDDQLQPVAIGIPGELYIGGSGLARGYLNRPDATAGSFIPHPFSTLPGSRLYKTGDRVRYRPDGSLEFLGRADHQVKLRGYRVELGEIEAALRQCPTVQSAIAVLREDTPGLPRLVGYAIAQADQVVDTGALRSQLQQRLPDYMVPAAILVLKAFPLLPNGKINRQALPAPAASSAEFVAPRNSIEERLGQIWAEVLQLEQVGIQDNFFDLGGHSLLATQIMSRLRQSFLVELPLHQFFESPTVAELAISISQALAEQANQGGLAELLSQLDSVSVDE